MAQNKSQKGSHYVIPLDFLKKNNESFHIVKPSFHFIPQMKTRHSNLLRQREDRFCKIKALSSILTVTLTSPYIISISRIIFLG